MFAAAGTIELPPAHGSSHHCDTPLTRLLVLASEIARVCRAAEPRQGGKDQYVRLRTVRVFV
jgi:hypothetical protein